MSSAGYLTCKYHIVAMFLDYAVIDYSNIIKSTMMAFGT